MDYGLPRPMIGGLSPGCEGDAVGTSGQLGQGPVIDVVVHPVQPQGIRGTLEVIDGIRLLAPADDDGVEDALRDGAPVLVTVVWHARFAHPSLRWVASVSAGFDQYPLERFAADGVTLTTAQGVNAVPMAEHAIGLLLACTRRIGQSARASTERAWIRRPSRFELQGSTVLILGLGTVGEQVARLAAAFGMHVIGIKRDPSSYRGEVTDVRGPEQLLATCAEADVLISVLPGGDETHLLIDADVLDALGRGFLISLGRGSVVDEAVLVEALETRRLRGAGLDVFATEPLPEDSPLWDIPTAVLTPHIGGTSPNYGRRFGDIFRLNLAAYRGEGDWVNRQVPTR